MSVMVLSLVKSTNIYYATVRVTGSEKFQLQRYFVRLLRKLSWYLSSTGFLFLSLKMILTLIANSPQPEAQYRKTLLCL